MMKKWMAGLLTLVLSVGLLTGCQVGDTQYVFYHKRVNNKTVFCANEEKCSLKEAKIYLCNYRNIYGGAYGMDLWTHEETAQDLEDYVKEVTLAELGFSAWTSWQSSRGLCWRKRKRNWCLRPPRSTMIL